MLKNQKAFTLIELMVTVTIISVVLALAVPSFQKQVLASRSAALGEDFISALNLMRYEAVKRAKRVSICASSNSTTASPSCTGAWKDGYIIFVDEATSDGATAVDLGSSPVIIKAYAKPDAKANITVKNNGATDVSFIRYTPLGSLARISNSNNPIIITAKLDGCVAVGKARTITINISGLPVVQKTNCLP